MSIQELKKELERFKYQEKSVMTEDEIKTLREMFKVKNSFKTLFKFLVRVETEKGTQFAYDLETLSPEDIEIKREVVRFARSKMETIRTQFVRDIENEIDELEKKGKEKKAKKEIEREEAQIKKELEKKGVGENI